MRRSEIHEILTSRGWLAEIDPALAAAVVQAGRTLALRKGELLYNPEDNPGGMFGVVAGRHADGDPGARRPAPARAYRAALPLVRLWLGPGKAAAQHDHLGQRADGAAARPAGRTRTPACGVSVREPRLRQARDPGRSAVSGDGGRPSDPRHGPQAGGRASARVGGRAAALFPRLSPQRRRAGPLVGPTGRAADADASGRTRQCLAPHGRAFRGPGKPGRPDRLALWPQCVWRLPIRVTELFDQVGDASQTSRQAMGRNR
jgi:hypothetical protein